MLIRYHPQIGHLYVPNLRARLPNENGGYFVVTNSLGFRSDVEFVRERSDRPRIVFLGDSYTAGDACENADRFSEKVGEALGAESYNYALSGSGTDQHLLIWDEFVADVEADLVVLCVQVDSIRRIQLSHRESIDRVTGRRILVPKPYFLLKDDELRLHHVPVPLERPSADSLDPQTQRASRSGPVRAVVDYYRHAPGLEGVRRVVRARMQRVQSEVYRLSGTQPYEEFRSAESPAWRLMAGIIGRIVDRVQPLPLLIVPIPTYQFTLHGTRPIYQPLFDGLADPARNVTVLDVSTPIARLPWKERREMSFRHDNHFSPHGHRIVADLIAERVRRDGLLNAPRPVRESESR